jgi:predicted ATPase
LSVGPVQADEVGRIIRSRLGADLSHPVVTRIHATAAGNPFFAIEIAREVLRGGPTSADGTLPVPDDLVELLRSRVDALPRSTRAALLVAASTPRPMLELVRSASVSASERPRPWGRGRPR